MTAVKENTNPSKTLIVSFTQITNKRTHESMQLRIINPFKQKLSYNASIFLMRQKKWVETDVYPIGSGMFGFETWPDIITSIALNKWNFSTQ